MKFNLSNVDLFVTDCYNNIVILNGESHIKKEKQMSDNKFKYFTVTTTTLVKANNQGDAQKLAMGRRGVTGEVMFKDVEIERISAIEAREQIITQ
jgi:hypothetical protein